MFGMHFDSFPFVGPSLQMGGRGAHNVGMGPFHNLFGQFERFATGDLSDQSRGQPATAHAVLQDLPTVKVTNYDIEQNNSPECVICLEPLVLGAQANRIPCGHLFHEGCIKDWLRESNQCPVCRYELPTDDARYEQERQTHTVCRQPRLRLADLTAKSVRELCYLARHLGVNTRGCIEKEELVQRLATSGAIELIRDEAKQNKFAMASSVPDLCKLSSAQLANMSLNELRCHMIHMGVDFTGCHQKRDLIQRLIDAGRVSSASSHGASEWVAPVERSIASELQDQNEGEGEIVEATSSKEDSAIVVFRHGSDLDTSLNCVEGSISAAKDTVCQQGNSEDR